MDRRFYSLSGALRSRQGSFDGDRLSLVGADVKRIDLLPERIALIVKSLYLSNNYIHSLDNIDQFQNLRVLSLSNNSVRYVDDLNSIAGLTRLERLSLSGNIVCKMPYYREHLIALCPNLKSIDGVNVSGMDHARAEVLHFKAKTLYEQLGVNEFRNCVLIHISKLLSCHVELSNGFLPKLR